MVEVWLGQRLLRVIDEWGLDGIRDGVTVRAVVRKHVLRGHNNGVSSVAALPKGGLVSGSGDTSVIIWDAQHNQKLVLQHTYRVTALAVLANGDIIGSADKTTMVWNKQVRLSPACSPLYNHACIALDIYWITMRSVHYTECPLYNP